ncbi:hypothetical protein CI109_104590 [Kwoniella shandongensis]|uniref:Uncharacterized protein n=1 Tax=Kwoniella shandongensis TaxID=1734106 RepID=A0A5M6BTF5_9TREE|nr:uncharacterized protein CI109_005520 [Kwoniella shandongensis]KAA5526087.1 hypothetical protein CI109_005520 [Kwoniella shandongensis]
MSLLASSIAGANYMTSNNEDRESSTNGAAEFTRRKKWPEILLKELVGGTIFCLKPVLSQQQGQQGQQQQQQQTGSNQQQSQQQTQTQQGNEGGQQMKWKIIYVSPAVGEMLGQKPADLEGRDFLELVTAADHSQLQTFLNTLLHPSPPALTHGNSSSTTSSSSSFSPPINVSHSDSASTYVRMTTSFPNDNSPSGSSEAQSTPSSRGRSGPVVWEIRGHATGIGEDGNPLSQSQEGFNLAGPGTVAVVPRGSGSGPSGDEGGMKGKAVWVMGRRVGDNGGDSEAGSGSGTGSNGQSLDAFLELKLENERLREELRELQLDLDEDFAPPRKTSFPDHSPSKPSYNPSSSPSSSSSSSPSSSPSSFSKQPLPSSSNIKPKLKPSGRPPKNPDGKPEKKRKKSLAGTLGLTGAGVGGGGGGKGEVEGMHVCVTCGRTDSPEWRKGPLGPKTLCNACGLRWAKRNSTQSTRKEKKVVDGKK